MKKVALFGDSIRLGYDKYVETALADECQVYYVRENNRFTAHFSRFLHEWKQTAQMPDDVDLVHWNVGLWDLLHLFGEEETLTSIEEYGRNLVIISNRLKKLFPSAKQIFATSTSIVESGYGKNFFRRNSEIEDYNKKAIEVLTPLGVEINDLYSYTCTLDEECRSDVTHFNTPKGVEAMGNRVVAVICRALDITANRVNIENFEPNAYTADNVGY